MRSSPFSELINFIDEITARHQRAPLTEADRRIARNKRRVVNYFDRLNARGIALGGK